jgi:FG-GAP repeat/FG-GAP-like repeat
MMMRTSILCFVVVAGVAGCGDDTAHVPSEVPALRSPANGAYLGSVRAAASLRPKLTWAPVTFEDRAAITYHVEISEDPSFTSGLIAGTSTDAAFTPSEPLAVRTSAPVGARYYWRVKACATTTERCADYSTTRSFNLGRSERDLNGDGYADLVVGAPWQGGGFGQVYIYFGGPAFDTRPDGIISSTHGRDLGTSVAAGDFNGDGFADLVVGAPLDDAEGGLLVGRAYVYFGAAGSIFDAVPDGRLVDSNPGDSFGASVACAGDVNGDGFADVLVGRPYFGGFGALHGRAHLYFGGAGATFEPTSDLTFTATNSRFGAAVASAGDLNGDGLADVLIGDPGDDAAGFDAGRAYVYLSADGALDTTEDVALGGTAPYQEFGYSLAAAGDVNGDGFGDFLVGSPHVSSSARDPRDLGRTALYFGDAEFARAPQSVSLAGDSMNDHFGISVAGAGDLNGDGFADVLIGAQRNNAGGYQAGRAYVYFGSVGKGFHTTAASALTGSSDSFLGSAAAAAGDLNGDGWPDLVIASGPRGTGLTAQWRGVAIHFGNARGSFDDLPDALLPPTSPYEAFGYSLAP